MQRFDLHGLELFSLQSLRLSPEQQIHYGSRLTQEFPGLTLEEAMSLQTLYPQAYASPETQDDRTLVFGNVFVLRRDDWTLLVDTGIGFLSPELHQVFALPAELNAAGIARDDVNAVFLTHYHNDHIGWVCTDGMPNFPNARHYFPLADLEPLRQQNPALYAAQIEPLLQSGWLELTEEFQTIAPNITTLSLPGHTPGQLGLWVDHDIPVIIAADALHYPMQVQHPDWQNQADTDPRLAVQSRRDLLAQTMSINALLCATHLPTPGVGRIAPRDSHLAWLAVSSQA